MDEFSVYLLFQLDLIAVLRNQAQLKRNFDFDGQLQNILFTFLFFVRVIRVVAVA